MLSNAYFLAKFRFDTAENEPAKNLQKFANFADPNPNAVILDSTRVLRTSIEIRNHYLFGWFLADLVSVVPFDIIFLGVMLGQGGGIELG